jgi:predicted Zn-dependent peptidase
VAIALGYKGIELRNPDRYALDVIDALVSGIRTSGGWLYDALRGGAVSYVYFIHATNWIGVDPGSFYVITQCSPENKDTVMEIIIGVFKRLYAGEIDEKELDAAKETGITAARIYYQTNGDRADRALHNELYGLGFNFHQQYEQRIRRVSLEDIKAAAEKYLKSPAVEVWTYPKKINNGVNHP